eukprot:CAMPEP_0118895516 /NCGR_PEP_ID=MMETSP1166-20130328/3839_1 /TAXON_ID=1104430 /ORGANISM="Chrysoreinhardia sp, Strain CCMP3193" /LENGTH=143 /DNA_ID=CAMNT_0006834559 /DNA_START=554 /DNA_END=981 /DNA_ORIENTATION=-
MIVVVVGDEALLVVVAALFLLGVRREALPLGGVRRGVVFFLSSARGGDGGEAFDLRGEASGEAALSFADGGELEVVGGDALVCGISLAAEEVAGARDVMAQGVFVEGAHEAVVGVVADLRRDAPEAADDEGAEAHPQEEAEDR